ncbi:MAG TPA: peptidase S53, partial [Arthrobacter bacterium]|nr:peptidase S53 [Arthrobacter sp.]HCC40370.1 peptidase S53 [Arthrobacter sp.]
PTTTSASSSETVWNDGPHSATGGGYSDTFPVPAWQNGLPANARHHKPAPKPSPGGHGRGVPDVSGVADPQTGYKVRVDGKDMVIGGTSAVAPLGAALIALFAQSTNRRFGQIQPLLYSRRTGFHDVTTGNNGTYQVATGWDPCTGLGSPDGTALVAAIKSGL